MKAEGKTETRTEFEITGMFHWHSFPGDKSNITVKWLLHTKKKTDFPCIFGDGFLSILCGSTHDRDAIIKFILLSGLGVGFSEICGVHG